MRPVNVIETDGISNIRLMLVGYFEAREIACRRPGVCGSNVHQPGNERLTGCKAG